MSELNPRQKIKARAFLKQRSGDKCSFCGKTGDQYRDEKRRDFDIHHKDRNRENNPEDGSNWELACHSCNCKNDPRGIRKNPYFSKFKNLKNGKINEKERGWIGAKEYAWEETRTKPPTMKKNEVCEPVFREAVSIQVAVEGLSRRKDLLDSCSEKASCSQQSGANYLDKMCSFFGMYEYVGIHENGSVEAVKSIRGYNGEIYVRKKQ